jgi:Cu/Ag efflux protein CusF
VSEENKSAEGESKAGTEGKAVEQKVNSVALNQKAREAIFAKAKESAAPPEAGVSKSDEGESEQDQKSEVGAQQSESAESEGDDKSSVDKSQKKDEKPKGNLEKALQEEREKRKKANLEARQLREKYEADMAVLRKEMDELKRPKQDDTEGDDGDPEKAALKRQLQEERAKREAADKVKQEENQQKQMEAYNEKITKTHNELKEAGFRGFKFCQTQTREAILKRFNEGEFVDTDLNDPAIWKKVFMEDVYESIKDEFPASNEKEQLDKKLDAKKKAAAISNPGPAPKVETEEKVPPTLEEMNKSYIKQRQDASRKVGA